jgi:hypothetical protein
MSLSTWVKRPAHWESEASPLCTASAAARSSIESIVLALSAEASLSVPLVGNLGGPLRFAGERAAGNTARRGSEGQ